jgi:hypothetical protein
MFASSLHRGGSADSWVFAVAPAIQFSMSDHRWVNQASALGSSRGTVFAGYSKRGFSGTARVKHHDGG